MKIKHENVEAVHTHTHTHTHTGILANKSKALKLIVFSIIVLIIISAIICVAFGKETYSKKIISGRNSKVNASKNTATLVKIFDDAEKYGGTKKKTSTLDLDSEIKYDTGEYSYDYIDYENMATKLDLPKREHYKFKGYYDVDGGKCYDEEGYSLNYAGERWDPTNANNRWTAFDKKLSAGDTITYHYTAKWEQTSTVTKTLDKKGGDGGADKLTQTKDGSIQVDGAQLNGTIAVPTKDKHTFLGYYNGDDKQRIDQNGNALFKTLGDEGTWHAKWKQKANTTLTVTLNKQNGTGGASEFTQVADSSGNTTVRIDGAQLTGSISIPSISKKYVFSGYNTKKDGSGTIKVDAQGTVKFTTINSDGTWYAMWALTSPINVTLDKQGGTGGINKITKITSGEIWQIDRGVSLGQSMKDQTIDIPTKSNSKFIGYYTEKDAKGSQRIDENGKILIDGNVNEIADDETWYAAYEDTTTPTPAPDPAPVKHTVTFDTDGGDGGPEPIVYEEGGFATIPDIIPTKTGYEFDGWRVWENETTSTTYRIGDSVSGGNVTLKAVWRAIYIITFDLNGGEGEPPASIKRLEAGSFATCPDITPTRTGYKFVCWNTEKDGTGAMYYPGKEIYEATCTLYAQWAEINTSGEFKLTAFYEDDFSDGETIVLKDGAYYQGENRTEKDGKLKIPTKEGYIFLGYWGHNQDDMQWVNADGSLVGGAGMYDGLCDYIESYPTMAWMTARWKKDENYKSVESVNIDSTGATIKIGESIQLTATITPDDATNQAIEWSSSDNTIATVDETGKVIAQKEGTVDIVAKSKSNSEKTATCKITIEPANVPVESISLDTTEETIKEDGNIQLTATVTPDNATNKNVSWESSNTSVAIVDNTGYVTAKSKGTATITATTEDGGKTATATITVKKEITDEQGPTIVSIKGEKDSEGNYKVIIKATDESGIEKVSVSGRDITDTKDTDGNYYFMPTKNGIYKIEVYDTEGNKTEQDYTESNIIEATKVTGEKDSNGNNIVYIETITNKKVASVKVNGTEIEDKDSQGRYYFKPKQNGTYNVTVEYEDEEGTTEEVEYTEDRITNNSDSNNNENNSGSNTTNNGNSSTNNSNNGSSNSGTNTGNSNKGSGTQTSGKSTSGNTIGTSTALTDLPKTGMKFTAIIGVIISTIIATITGIKQKKIKM